MKHFRVLSIISLMVTGISINIYGGTRVSEYGSNSYMNHKLFPQNILQWQGNFLYYYPDYMKSPWWGDIDDPGARPNATYTITGGSEEDGEANYDHSANIHSIGNRLGYAYKALPGLMTSYEMEYNIDAMSNSAQGRITDVDSLSTFVPFDYSMGHTLNSFSLQGMLGTMAGGMPMGLRMKLGFENTLALNNELTFQKDGRTYNSERALWGWTNKPCAHIFGSDSPEADAWLQREYAQGPMYTVEIQGGVTMPKSSLGMLTMFRMGHQDQYVWQTDPANTTEVDSNFVGSYQKSNWSRKSRDIIISTYANFELRSNERYKLNNFFMIGYQRNSAGRALAADLSIEDDAVENRNIFFIEYSPNISLFSKDIFHYVDAAVVTDYSYSRAGNTYEMGLPGEGTKKTYWNTSVRDEDITFEEDFSYSNKNFIDVGADLSVMFPVLSDENNQLGLGLDLLLNSRYTFETRYYGDNNNSAELNVTGRRENYMREVWFNSALVLQFMRMPYHLRLEVTEPLLYSVLPHTKVYRYNDGPAIDYEHRKNPTWVGQQGMRVAMYLSRQWTMPFLR